MKMRTRSKKKIMYGGLITIPPSAPIASQKRWYDTDQVTTIDYHKKKKRIDKSTPPSFFERDRIERYPYIVTGQNGVAKFHEMVIRQGHTPDKGDPYKPVGSSARNSENQAYAMELLARTNPFRPEFSVPQFVRELIELPTLFRLAAKTFAGYAGGGYLNYRFGWLPFVNDIKTLATITRSIERRLRELKSLTMKGGLRRRVELASIPFRWSGDMGVIESAYNLWIRANLTSTRSMKVYGTCRWRATYAYWEEVEALQNFNDACKIVFDLKAPDPETVWNIIPFSWLVDYFVKIGEWLQAGSGRVLVEPYDICIMRHWRSREKFQVYESNAPNGLAGPGVFIRDVISRDVVVPSSFPTVRTDLLSVSQWKVVLALFGSFRG